MLLVRGPLRSRPDVGAFAVGSIAVWVTLQPLTGAGTQILDYLMLSYLTIVMLAVAMFMPWGVRQHVTWLATTATGVLLIAFTPLGDALDPAFREHLVTGGLVAAIVSLAGHLMLQRQRVRTFASEQQVRTLHHRSRAHETELQRLNLELETVSRIDPLTGVGNRLRLEEDVNVLRARLARRGGRGAVVLVDIDRFKRYNDTFGHLAGDTALRAVADALRGALRAEDGVYRYGGEEFLLILSDTNEEEASVTVERLHAVVDRLALQHPENKPWGVVTFSAGVAPVALDRESDEWLRDADQALYRAKAAGRNATELAPAAPAPTSGKRRHLRAAPAA
jgi:diguanylate cyclase (GGDEF)-like protein